MIGDDEGHALITVQAAAQRSDAGVGVEQRLAGEAPHGEDQLGPDQFDLAREKRRALRHFRVLGIAVSRRPALEHIGDVDVLPALQVDAREHAVEQFPRLTNKGLAARVFFGAWRLAHQQPVGLLVADAEHGLGTGFAQAAGRARGDCRLEFGPVHARDAPGAIVRGRRGSRRGRLRDAGRDRGVRDGEILLLPPLRSRLPGFQPPQGRQADFLEEQFPARTHSGRPSISASSRPACAG